MPRFGGQLDIAQVSSPPTPPAGRTLVYPKSNGKVYSKAPSGAESMLSPNVFVGPTNPGIVGVGLWMQTGLGTSGSDFTLWFEDGVV